MGYKQMDTNMSFAEIALFLKEFVKNSLKCAPYSCRDFLQWQKNAILCNDLILLW
jgi:hypothetical protein